jgi:tRNA A-37 threonylcarbamoyl transferase component Bud32
VKYSSHGLIAAGRDLIPPFSVDVSLDPLDEHDESDGPFHFESVARVLPGRRVSGIGEFRGARYFAKIFVGPQARRYWRRELVGSARMLGAGVPTPRVLRRGALADSLGYALFFEVLEEAEDLREDDADGIGAAVELVADLHQAGLVQTDVHLGNFVASGGRLHAVDADGIRRAQLLRVHFANLGMLLAQRRPIYDGDIGGFWQGYAARRGEYVTRMGSERQLEDAVDKQRRERVRRYLRKTLRECSDFHRLNTFRANVLCQRPYWQALQRLCLFPESQFGEGTALKLGNSATVVRLEIDGERYIVKRYNIKGPAHRVKRWFKRRARNAWRNGHLLAFLGIPTARPVALIERRWGWFVGSSYLVMPDVGDVSLDQVLRDQPDRFAVLAPRVVDVLKQLAAAGLEHGDLKATNFVVHGDAVALIDYDAVRKGDHRKDVERFLRNWYGTEIAEPWRAELAAAGLLAENGPAGERGRADRS